MNNLEVEMKQHCMQSIAESLQDYDPYVGQIRYKSIQKLQDENQIDQNEIHPWFSEIASKVGLVAGRGKYWNWGDNYTVDPVVITSESNPSILLVQRADNQRWAFPGGFIDSEETAIQAGVRECQEETGVSLVNAPERIVYEGVVADERTTAHAWANTTAILWRPESTSEATGADDATDAQWFTIDALPDRLHGSHAKIIELALKDL